MGRAFVVIDMLNDFIRPNGALYCGQAAEAIVPAIAEGLREARESGVKIFYVCDNHRPDDPEFEIWPAHCVAGTWGAQIIDELAPTDNDIVVPKRRYSGFFGTDLLLHLLENGISRIELCGVCTNICVLYTAADARNLGFKVLVHPGRVASFDSEAHEWALKQMKEVLGVEVAG